MYFETKEQCYNLTDDQINKLTYLECRDIEHVLDYDDPIMDKVYARMRYICMIEDMDSCANKLTVGQIKKLIKDLSDDDIVQIYDTYTETSYEVCSVSVPDAQDKHNRKHLIIQIDTD